MCRREPAAQLSWLSALPQRFHSTIPRHVVRPMRWSRSRFGSGLVRMGGARLERATSCL
jgi:hypothetical protein